MELFLLQMTHALHVITGNPVRTVKGLFPHVDEGPPDSLGDLRRAEHLDAFDPAHAAKLHELRQGIMQKSRKARRLSVCKDPLRQFHGGFSAASGAEKHRKKFCVGQGFRTVARALLIGPKLGERFLCFSLMSSFHSSLLSGLSKYLRRDAADACSLYYFTIGTIFRL